MHREDVSTIAYDSRIFPEFGAIAVTLNLLVNFMLLGGGRSLVVLCRAHSEVFQRFYDFPMGLYVLLMQMRLAT